MAKQAIYQTDEFKDAYKKASPAVRALARQQKQEDEADFLAPHSLEVRFCDLDRDGREEVDHATERLEPIGTLTPEGESRLRATIALSLHRRGATQESIGRILGVSRQRVGQMLADIPPDARAHYARIALA